MIFFDSSSSTTLTCYFTVHRAGSQLKNLDCFWVGSICHMRLSFSQLVLVVLSYTPFNWRTWYDWTRWLKIKEKRQILQQKHWPVYSIYLISSTVLPRILTSAIIWRGLAVGNYTSRYNCIWRKFHILAEKAGRPKSCSIQSITAYHMPIKVRFRRNFAVNSSSSHLSFI